MIEYLSVPYLVNKYKSFNENFNDNSSPEEEISNNQQLIINIIFIITVLIVAALYYWAISALINFNIPPLITIICIIFLLIGNPLYAIIFLYLFKDKLLM